MAAVRTLWPPTSMISAVMPMIEQANKNHCLLTEKVFALTAVPSGPYALFHHNAHVSERIADIQLIFTRLVENRKQMTKLNEEEQTLGEETEKNAKLLQTNFLEKKMIHQQMKLDMESLFIFGNLLLDQWAYVIGYLIGYNQPQSFNFVQMVNQLQKKGEKGLLQPLWENHSGDILWLLYQIRNYRNIFIEHVREPWQRGTAMETYGESFRLASPSPVDWIAQDEIEQLVKNIAHFAPEWAKHPELEWYTKHPRQLLEIIFFYIDEISEQSQRECVWEVWKKIGGWTFSYDIVAFRLMRFIANSASTTLSIITNHPEAINVGGASRGNS